MDILQFLFRTATATVFVFTAMLFWRFLQFPLQPYTSVVMTRRWLRTHHIETVALVAFSFLVFALIPAETGFRGAEAVKKIWETDKRQVELLYLSLFVLGSTGLAVLIEELFRKLLVIPKGSKQFFTDVYFVFLGFIILWFVLLAALIRYFFDLSGASIEKWEFRAPVKDFLTDYLKISDVSDLFVSPALWIMVLLSGIFGYRMISRWAIKRGIRVKRAIRTVVPGKEAQKVLSGTVIMLATALVAFVFVVVPALYIAILSATLLTRSSPRSDFEYAAACYVAGNKMHVTMSIKNNKNTSAPALRPLFLDWPNADKALKSILEIFFGCLEKGSTSIRPN
jgi:hypothetical protein